MLALGIGRYLSIKASNYHEHVTEYGVHWNFFLTLAATKFVSALFFLVFPVGWCWVISVTLSICHEGALSTRLAEWALDDARPRDTFLEANREGIVSVPGYVAIYLAGVDWGNYLSKANTSFGSHVQTAKDLRESTNELQ
jgi:phosphatidylinositol glycan class W